MADTDTQSPETPAEARGARDGAAVGQWVRDTATGAWRVATHTASDVGEAVSDSAEEFGERVERDGLVDAVTGSVADAGTDAGRATGEAANGLMDRVGSFFRNTRWGGFAGGLLGVLGAWLVGSAFGGGMFGMVVTVLLAPFLFMLGRNFGNDNLSNLFGQGNRDRAAGAGQSREVAADAPAQAAAQTPPSPAQAQTPEQPATGSPTVSTAGDPVPPPPAPPTPEQLARAQAERLELANTVVAGGTGRIVSTSAPLAFANDATDIVMGQVLVEASMAVRNLEVSPATETSGPTGPAPRRPDTGRLAPTDPNLFL